MPASCSQMGTKVVFYFKFYFILLYLFFGRLTSEGRVQGLQTMVCLETLLPCFFCRGWGWRGGPLWAAQGSLKSQ